jgi:hypothetical protein
LSIVPVTLIIIQLFETRSPGLESEILVADEKHMCGKFAEV